MTALEERSAADEPPELGAGGIIGDLERPADVAFLFLPLELKS